MTLSADADAIRLQGSCPVEDAEPLLALLLAQPGLVVDLTAAGTLHTAVLQLLLALRPPMRGPLPDAFLHRWIEPLLISARTG